MITACKSHITDRGRETVWSQTRDEVLKKLRDCLTLNDEYQKNFHKTKVCAKQQMINCSVRKTVNAA